MNVPELIVAILFGYFVFLLVLELVIWKVQPDMEGVITVHLNTGTAVVERKLYGLEYNNSLYVASNHWFRTWYHTIVKAPVFDVEREGKIASYTATPVSGDERVEVTQAYGQSFMLRLLCGFAPQRYLRLDPR